MQEIVQQIAQRLQNQFYGKYRGFVIDNKDPEKRGRLKVKVPSVLGDQDTGWALPCLPFGGLADQGLFMIPQVDAQVWLEFEEGNIDHPIWVGVFWQQESDVPTEAALAEPTTRVIKTPSGHVLQFDDADGEEQFRIAHPAGSEVIIDPNGSISLEDAAGAKVMLDADTNKIVVQDSNGNVLTMDSNGTVVEDSNGNKIEMAASGITVKATQIIIDGSQVHVGGSGGEPLIKGTTFLSMFNSHIHNCTAPGAPSGPPIPPLTPAVLTTATKAK